MTDLQTHMQIFKGLGFVKHRNAIIRMIWQVATEHASEITLEDFIKAISSTPTTTDAVQPVKKE